MTWAADTSTPPVTVLLAAPDQGRVDAWYHSLAGDARFRVVATATSAADFAAKRHMRPEALLLDGLLFHSAADLSAALSGCDAAVWVLLPAQATEAEAAAVAAAPAVRQVFRGDANLAAEAGRLYETALALRLAPAAGPGWDPLAGGAPAGVPAGLRVIAVWNHAGGTGKTTLATNLAFEARRRGLKALLVGLGAPDDTAVVLPRAKASPNLSHWNANPTPDGLRAALQSVDGLDVLAGYPDVAAAEQCFQADPDAPGGLRRLVMTAASAGYGVIILDAPALERAALALSAANQLLLVARPTLGDALRSVEAFRTVTERLAGQHLIPARSLRLALNQVRPGAWTPQQFHEACSALLDAAGRRAFPPVVAAIPDDARVPEAQNAREFPLLRAPEFQRAFMPLAEACLQAGPRGDGPEPRGANGRRTFSVGPLRIKV